MTTINVNKVPYAIMFHHFHPDGEQPAAQGSTTPGDLRKNIEYIGVENILPAHIWQEKAISNTLNERDICLTFDDALKSQIKYALPVLKEYGLTAFWFIYSSVFLGHKERLEIYKYFYNKYFPDFNSFYNAFKENLIQSEYGQLYLEKICEFSPGKYLSEFAFYSDIGREYRFIRDQILGREKFQAIMDRILFNYKVDIDDISKHLWMDNDDLLNLSLTGHIVGLHSFSHPTDLKSLDPFQQEKEYKMNKQHIQEITQQEPLSVSHPCNSYNEYTLKLLSEMGIKVGFRANFVKMKHYSALEHPREDHVRL